MNAAERLPAQFNVATYFVDRHLEEGRADAPAFFCEERTLTYGDVAELANRAGNALRDLGVEMEDRVLLLCLDAPEFLGAFWGAIKMGAVPIPVNTMMRAQDYLYFLDDSRARVAVISAPLLAEAGPVLGQARFLKHVLVAGGSGHGHLSWEDQLARASSRLEAAPTSRDDPAFWLYSSGSTGFPKGAVHLHHDMVICQETYAKQVLGIGPTDRVFSAAKLFFAYGLGNAGYFPMGVGAQSVLSPHRPTPEGVFEILTRHRPTLFFGVPTLYAGHAGGEGGGEALRPLVAAPVRLGRRGAARGDLPALARALRRGDRGRHRHHGDPAHLPVQPAGRGAPRIDGPPGAGLRGHHRGRRGPSRSPRARSATSG